MSDWAATHDVTLKEGLDQQQDFSRLIYTPENLMDVPTKDLD